LPEGRRIDRIEQLIDFRDMQFELPWRVVLVPPGRGAVAHEPIRTIFAKNLKTGLCGLSAARPRTPTARSSRAGAPAPQKTRGQTRSHGSRGQVPTTTARSATT